MQPHNGGEPYAYELHTDESFACHSPFRYLKFADFVIKDESGNALLIGWLSIRTGRNGPLDTTKIRNNCETGIMYGSIFIT